MTERARITVLHNGIVVHNNVQLRDATTAVSGRYFGPAPLLLQDHTNPVKFRNIWLVPLPSEPKG